jgi:hypothetical protein
LSKKKREVAIGIGAGYQIDRFLINQFFAQPLGHAANQSDNQFGAFFSEAFKEVEAPPDALFGIVANRAGVD